MLRQENTLSTRETTIAHWHFRGDLLDASDAANDLTAVNAATFEPGYTEPGLTGIARDGSSGLAGQIVAADAGDFDFGLQSFTIEVIFKSPGVADFGRLIHKFSQTAPLLGWHLTIIDGATYFGGGPDRLRGQIGDGVTTFSLDNTTDVGNSGWHHAALVVDRQAGTARLWIDGIATNAAQNIAALGAIAPVTAALGVAQNFAGEIDEICISLEALTAAVIAERHAGRMRSLYPDGDDEFLLRFLPEVNQGNSDLAEFLLPETRQYLFLRALIDDLSNLVQWNRCPNRFLDLLASRIGFELPHASIASEYERRRLLQTAVTLYRQKGTIHPLAVFLTNLGYVYALVEVFAPWTPLRANTSRTHARSIVGSDLFFDDFSSGNLAKWNQPLSLASWWRISGGKLLGNGDGTALASSGISFNQTATRYLLEVEFEVQSGYADGAAFGVYLRYQDVNNFVRIEVRRSGSVNRLVYSNMIGGVAFSEILYTFSASEQWYTGLHTLRIHADALSGVYTIALDGKTLSHAYTHPIGGVATTKKGLYINTAALTVAVSQVRVATTRADRTIRLISASFTDRSIDITLMNTPTNDAEKRIYLAKVLPNYLPVGVSLNLS